VVIANVYERAGGAARAANRLHKGLISRGVDSTMLVQVKHSDDDSVLGPVGGMQKAGSFFRPYLDALPVKLYRKRTGSKFSTALIPGRVRNYIKTNSPDIVNLHWIINGMFRIEELAGIPMPVVWTLHDAWAFTGGCTYPMDCIEYRKNCGACPELGSKRIRDLSHWVLGRKRRAWRNLDVVVVSPSRWLAEEAASSSLFSGSDIRIIPNGLDLDLYRPHNKKMARHLLGLSENKTLLLFGAVSSTSDRRKGFSYLNKAMTLLKERPLSDTLHVVVFGASGPGNNTRSPLPASYLGHFEDDLTMSLLYSAADLFVAPSIQDNLPNTVMEASACGTPSVAFKIGGMPDLIDHMKTGFLVRERSPEGLAGGIEWTIREKDRLSSLGLAARKKAEKEYSYHVAAERYYGLYEEVIRTSRRKSNRGF
jgi:glycosyltransferase involved in cell wall biosynthesis